MTDAKAPELKKQTAEDRLSETLAPGAKSADDAKNE